MSIKTKMKNSIAMLLAAAMLLPTPAFAASPSGFSDFPTDWSRAALAQAVENGLLSGANGRINAEGRLSRAEMAAIVNRAFGASSAASLSGFTDVSRDAWYYQDMAKAVRMGTFTGSNGRLSPESAITREEAFAVLARAFALEDGSASTLNGFADGAAVSSWACGGVAAMVENGCVQGSNGLLNPDGYITRAEFAQVMYTMAQRYVNAGETLSQNVDGSVIVRGAGAVLENMTVNGDLILADGIGAEDVTLKNVTVTGRIIIRGGEDCVKLTNSSAAGGVVISNPNGDTLLEVSGGKLNTVTVKTDLIVDGELDTVVIVDEATVTVLEDGKIDLIRAEADGARVDGDGRVTRVQADADDVRVTVIGTKVTAGSGTSGVKAGSKPVDAGETKTVEKETASSSSSSSSSSKNKNTYVYVLMNIPYDDFYKAEVNNSVKVDAVTSATFNKPRTGTLVGGSYHAKVDGSEITGITFPVRVKKNDLAGFKQVTDSDSVTIEVTNRGQTSTITYEGRDALFENASYAYYLLNETPSSYKEMSVVNGEPVFGKLVGSVQKAEGASAELMTETGYGDYQINVTADELSDATVYGVVLMTAGHSYGLRHLENIWRGTNLAFCTGFTDAVHNCPTSSAHYASIMGETITKITYYTSKGIYEIETNLYVPKKFENTLAVDDAGVDEVSTTVAMTGFPDDYEASYTVDDKAAIVTDGELKLTDLNLSVGSHMLTVSDEKGVYAPYSTTFVVSTTEMPAKFDGTDKLVENDGSAAEKFNAYLANITSVSVGGKAYAASGRGAVVMIDNQTGAIKLDAKSGENAIFAAGQTYAVKVTSTGYPELSFDLTIPAETPDPVEGELVVADQTKIVDLGWSQYVAVRFADGCSLDNSTLTIDGVDVTSAFTKVDDDGTIAKWELTALNPAKLVVTSGEKTQTVALSSNADPTAPEVKGNTAPAYFLTHGVVEVWDYYLTNYDEDGKVRVSPKKTTFDLDETSSSVAYYAPDTVLDENGNGDVVIMFNYSTAEDKSWFDGITNAALVQYDERLDTLNASLTYTAQTNVEHHGGYVAQLTIPFNQNNFRMNGRYYVRVTSNGKGTLIPIHVVNCTVPTMQLKESPETGKNLHFAVQDMTYGVTMPVYRVTLQDPTGEVRELEKIRDYYLIGDLFVLYNDVEAADGRNNIPYNGNYTITVYADGFQPMSKSFTVSDGADAPNTRAAAYRVDAVTRATSSGGSSSGGDSSGSGTTMGANLLFNADLLANAGILHKLSIGNAYADGIYLRWTDDITGVDAVYDEEGTTHYDYTDYIDAVQTAKTAGQYLSFADYAASGDAKTTPNRPYQVKEVLEDNLLGDIQYMRDLVGRDPAEMELEDGAASVAEGENIVLVCGDPAYLAAVAEADEIYLNGYSAKLRKDEYLKEYSIDLDEGTLTIYSTCDKLKLGDNTIQLTAEGYKANTVTVPYEKTLEEFTLSAADGRTGEAVAVTCEGEGVTGDFWQNLTSVKLVYPDHTEKTVYPDGYESTSEKIGYTIDGATLTLGKDLFTQAGEYSVRFHAEYYGSAQTVEFTVEPAEDQPVDPEDQTPPAVAAVSYVGGFSSYYRVSFDGDAVAYLKNIDTIQLNGEPCTKLSYSFWNDTNSFKLSNDSAYAGDNIFIDFTEDCFPDGETVEVTISATGYKDLTFTVKNGELDNGGEEPDEPDLPVASAKVDNVQNYNSWVELMFSSATSDDWFDKISSVSVNGTAYEKAESSYCSGNKFFAESNFFGTTVTVGNGSLKKGEQNTVVISAEGYQDFTYTFMLS